MAFFRTQLVEAPWRAVFREWIGHLLPATPSAGGHGLLRTAHALHALAHAETALRVEELGVALAYWAAYYRTLREQGEAGDEAAAGISSPSRSLSGYQRL